MLIYDVMHKEKVYHIVANDLRNFGIKYRFRKSILKTEKYQRCKNVPKKVFKTPLSYQSLDVVNLSSGGIVHIPVFVSQASTFLENYITQEGLFRKAGSRLRQKELMACIDNGGTLGDKHHAIDVANCLKSFFRNLPEPLIPYAYHELFIHCIMLKSSHVQALLLACILLPPYHLNTLAFFMEFLQKISMYEKQNKMSIDNLAKVIGPNIMPLQENTVAAVQNRLEAHLIVVKILIENAQSIGILPDHIMQMISETSSNMENESDIDAPSQEKHKKKEHRSGSVTRVFNGLKKIVGKSGPHDDATAMDNQHISTSTDVLFTSLGKITKKRKIGERTEPPVLKKKNDKLEKSKKLRLSLDRFVPKIKQKSSQPDLESSTNTVQSCTERRSYTCDYLVSQKKHRRHSDILSHLHLTLKRDEAVKSDFEKEYNDVFFDADVNLSDDGSDEILPIKEDHNEPKLQSLKLSRSSEALPVTKVQGQMYRRVSDSGIRSDDFEISLIKDETLSRKSEDSEEYVRIPRSEYEDIKNRVSAIESRISQEFGSIKSGRSLDDVQMEYEKTLEEAGSIDSTVTTDQLAKKLGKELKIRRSAEHKIIRSPSARKIGNLRRRSQERVASRRLSRTASWHVSQGSIQQEIQLDQPANNIDLFKKEHLFNSGLTERRSLPRMRSDSLCNEHDIKFNFLHKQFSTLTAHPIDFTENTLSGGSEMIQEERREFTPRHRINPVCRVSSFQGIDSPRYSLRYNDKLRRIKKDGSQENTQEKYNSKEMMETCRKVVSTWKDADRYFKSPCQGNISASQTGRASVAKLRAQNAGMVLAKAKLFDENTKVSYAQDNTTHEKALRSYLNDENSSKSFEINSPDYTVLNSPSRKITIPDRRKRKSPKNKCSNLKASKRSPNVPVKVELNLSDGVQRMQRRESEIDEQGSHKTNDRSQRLIYNGSEGVFNRPIGAIDKRDLTPIYQRETLTATSIKKASVNAILQSVNTNAPIKTPTIKRQLVIRTPRSSRALGHRPNTDIRRNTPMKAVQLGTPRRHVSKDTLKTKNFNRYVD